jgi:NAD(P)-dependent dehydrogenase (short-subunit alcohol dehydrogenase family)
LDAAIGSLLEAADRQSSVLVNNAAVQHFEDVDHFDIDLFEKTLFVNTLVPFALAQALLPAMVAKGRGTIVNIASDLAYRPQVGGSAYVASKWGLLGMSQVLQEEVRLRGVRVCVIEPGWIATGPERERRLREGHMLPSQVADVVAWAITSPDGVRLDRITLHPPAQGTWG